MPACHPVKESAMSSRSNSRNVLSLIYFHNPFYLISATLFVYGLKLLFRDGNSSVLFEQGTVTYMQPWSLLASLAGVTVLMAVTAVLIVRCGKVWEDARSLVLIVLLMLLAIAVSMDELINVVAARPDAVRHLWLLFALGSSFAVFTTLSLIRGLRIRLPLGYTLPLVGFLLLFFLWPSLLVPQVTGFASNTTQKLICLFPVVAAGLTMTLIPAIRRGRQRVEDNGTPWGWPLVPWSPFVFIGPAVCFRSYTLTMSFDPVISGHYWDTIFNLYQLVPLALAVAFVLLEISFTEDCKGLRCFALFSAPLPVLAAWPGITPWSHLPACVTFADMVATDLASPVMISLTGLAAFYGYAAVRGVRTAEAGFWAASLFACLTDPQASEYLSWGIKGGVQNTLLLGVLVVIQLFVGLRKKSSIRLAIATGAAIWGLEIPASSPEISKWSAFIQWNLSLLIYLAIGLSGRDTMTRLFRQTGPLALTVTMGAAIWTLPLIWLQSAYFTVMTILALGLHLVTGDIGYRFSVAVHLAAATAVGSVLGLRAFLGARLPEGVRPVILAVVSFLIAVAISILKSGVGRRIRLMYYRQLRRKQEATLL